MEKKQVKIRVLQYGNNEGIAITKEENGIKRRYLAGVTTGPQVDGDGERLTQNCIKSIMRQMEADDILLYAGTHEGVESYQDIGILTTFKQNADGDIYTEYRLYDEIDGFGAVKLDFIETVWKQLNGLAPYTKPKQRGFSIDGVATVLLDRGQRLPNGEYTGRVIEDMTIEKVVLVDKPAYNSIANAIAKSLNEPTAQQVKKTKMLFWSHMSEVAGLDVQKSENEMLSGDLVKSLEKNEAYRMFHDRKYELEDAFRDQIESIMRSHSAAKEGRLDALFDEYKKLMIPLYISAEEVFLEEAGPIEKESIEGSSGETPDEQLQKMLDEIKGKLSGLLSSVGENK